MEENEENPEREEEQQGDEPSDPEPQPDPKKPWSEQQPAETERKGPLNPTESFVHEMVENSKKKFDPPKPNHAEEDREEIEKLTKKIKDKIQRS
ncbi:MAG: hypothetical protein R6U32_04080 [Candidatus Woesearchaeota archaeon]